MNVPAAEEPSIVQLTLEQAVRLALQANPQVQNANLTVAERQEGRLEIVLLPGGKATFHPELTPVP